MTHCPAANLLLLFMVIIASCGCSSNPSKGYSSATIFPSGMKTVAVPIFGNNTLYRDVEFELADALIKEIEARTPYKVTPEGRADTILLGQIRDVQLEQLSKSRTTGLTEEGVVSVTIDFQWKDRRTGKILVERKAFTGHGLFIPSQPTSEPIAIGKFAAVEHLAQDVVSQMQAEW